MRFEAIILKSSKPYNSASSKPKFFFQEKHQDIINIALIKNINTWLKFLLKSSKKYNTFLIFLDIERRFAL
jgi:hypothetical protein